MLDNNPQRRLYAVAAGLVLLCALVFCLTWFLTEQTLHIPINQEPLPQVTGRPASPPPAPTPPAIIPPKPRDRHAIDPDIQRMADELADRSQPPVRDLEIVGEFIGLYSKVFHSNPIGLNEDITAALTGRNPQEGILFPPNNAMVVKGQLVDRWNTPYWFHPSSSHQMEIRSAGPDKNLFTTDDLVINPTGDHAAMGLAQP
jgi:hypothetical protein